jgi:hypothetical protein
MLDRAHIGTTASEPTTLWLEFLGNRYRPGPIVEPDCPVNNTGKRLRMTDGRNRRAVATEDERDKTRNDVRDDGLINVPPPGEGGPIVDGDRAQTWGQRPISGPVTRRGAK